MVTEELRMRCLVPAVLLLSFTGLVFSQSNLGQSNQGQSHQGQHWSLGGFGSIAGTGHAPTATPPVGQFVAAAHGGGGYSRGFANPGRASHPQHASTVIVPYPVYYGGYYGGAYGYGGDPSAAGYAPGYGSGYVDDGSNGPGVPSVVINQSFVPPQANPQVREYTGDQTQPDQSGLKLYQAPPSHPYADAQRAANSDQPTIYLIAFRDHTIVQALGYWMQGSTLHYVSAEQTLNQVSIDLVDRDLSQRLNDERGLDFRLPQPR
jgi:hypothetical protein